MLYVGAILLIQLACVVHVIKTGRSSLWIMAIMFAPLLGSFAYFLLEIAPGMGGNKYVRHAKKKAVGKIDPEREVRAARERLELTDSIANRTALADALAGAGKYREALDHYDAIAASPHGLDDRLRHARARALFETGQNEAALEQLDAIESNAQTATRDRQMLLRARILEELANDGEASAIYADIVTRMTGIEARGRYAALLLRRGDRQEAREQLEEITRTARQLDFTQLDDERPIADWAREQLREMDG